MDENNNNINKDNVNDEANQQNQDSRQSQNSQQPPFNNYNQNPGFQHPGYQRKVPPANGLAVTSLVLGIIAIISTCVQLLSIPCGVISIILAGIAKGKGNRTGIATAGLVLGIIAVVISIIYTILLAIGISLINLNDITRTS